MVDAPLGSLQIQWFILLFAVGFVASFFLTPLVARFSKRKGIVGIDAHKLNKPSIPEMCGVAIWAALAIASLVLILLDPSMYRNSAAFFLCITLAAIIGAWDDLKPLSPKVKPMLTAFAAIPILAFEAYTPYLRLPFLGSTRLTILYPLLVPVAMAVLTNTINMMNPFNGAMSGTCSVASFTMIICFFVLGQSREALLACALFGAILAFHYYNRYPARVFSGDAGDLCVGAAIGALSIIGRIEVPMVIVMIPHISNAFYLLSTVGGLKERREIKVRPTKLLKDGRLDATDDQRAPITLSRMILAKGPLREDGIVRIMILLTVVSSVLSVMTLVWLR